MSWITIIMDPDDNKVKINWFYLNKIVLGTIREDQFLYISLEFDLNTVLITTIFFFFDPFPLRSSFCFILSSFFHPTIHV